MENSRESKNFLRSNRFSLALGILSAVIGMASLLMSFLGVIGSFMPGLPPLVIGFCLITLSLVDKEKRTNNAAKI